MNGKAFYYEYDSNIIINILFTRQNGIKKDPPLALVSPAPGPARTPMTPLPPAPAKQLPQPALTAPPAAATASAAQMALAQVFDEIAMQLTLQVERAVLEVGYVHHCTSYCDVSYLPFIATYHFHPLLRPFVLSYY